MSVVPLGTRGSTVDIGSLLRSMVEVEASDLLLSDDAAPLLHVDGRHLAVDAPPLRAHEVMQLAQSLMNEEQLCTFQKRKSCDFALAVKGVGRFRINVFMQRGQPCIVVRLVRAGVPDFATLHLPPQLAQLSTLRQGLVLVVGATGCGKSTTMAAMLQHRKHALPGHILTIEDPIEFDHAHGRSLVHQREVGLDTPSYEDALRDAMRESAGAIFIGEIREREVMRHALRLAETGHLCVATLHANNANQALERIVNLFPESVREQVLLDLSVQLKGVVAQRLLPSTSGGRVPATELMLQTSHVADLVRKGAVEELKTALARGNERGMHSFDQSLFELYDTGLISLADALDNADSRTDLALRIRLSQGVDESAETSGWTALARMDGTRFG